MGRNSGGVNNISDSGNNGNNRVYKGTTEKGYTAKMVKNIVGLEQKYRRNKDETLHVFNDKGDIIASFGGKGAQVLYDAKKIPANSILTHNHPRSIGESGIRRIGNSFSSADIVSAVKTNAKEMRAVTPTYTFSVKRPKGGWGVTVSEIRKTFATADVKVRQQGYSYLNKAGWSESSIARAEVTHWHKVMKIVAKKYGWDYSKKNK